MEWAKINMNRRWVEIFSHFKQYDNMIIQLVSAKKPAEVLRVMFNIKKNSKLKIFIIRMLI